MDPRNVPATENVVAPGSTQAYFYRFPDGTPNFGDDLNKLLLPKLFPDLIMPEKEVCADQVLLGIGTLINPHTVKRLQFFRRKFVFSTGYGYAANQAVMPALGADWNFSCVRGPLSARQLGLPADRAVTDGAMLVNRLLPQLQPRSARPAFMPHVTTAKVSGEFWERLCSRLGMTYLDPRMPTEKLLAELAGAAFLVTEAMHGAIVADAYRTPWIPVVITDVLEFKWIDWCSSLDLQYKPHVLPTVWPGAKDLVSRARAACKSIVIERKMKKILRSPSLQLSSDTVLSAKLNQLQERAQSLAEVLG